MYFQTMRQNPSWTKTFRTRARPSARETPRPRHGWHSSSPASHADSDHWYISPLSSILEVISPEANSSARGAPSGLARSASAQRPSTCGGAAPSDLPAQSLESGPSRRAWCSLTIARISSFAARSSSRMAWSCLSSTSPSCACTRSPEAPTSSCVVSRWPASIWPTCAAISCLSARNWSSTIRLVSSLCSSHSDSMRPNSMKS
mmetsp:Transcript_101383/g.287068  ORF Transcript_101383/g.287068 Transcript_101383/m.287068 type:complete len:203 (-) Transcript_101383:26-634(-)